MWKQLPFTFSCQIVQRTTKSVLFEALLVPARNRFIMPLFSTIFPYTNARIKFCRFYKLPESLIIIIVSFCQPLMDVMSYMLDWLIAAWCSIGGRRRGGACRQWNHSSYQDRYKFNYITDIHRRIYTCSIQCSYPYFSIGKDHRTKFSQHHLCVSHLLALPISVENFITSSPLPPPQFELTAVLDPFILLCLCK